MSNGMTSQEVRYPVLSRSDAARGNETISSFLVVYTPFLSYVVIQKLITKDSWVLGKKFLFRIKFR
jgi:hypothetical protein